MAINVNNDLQPFEWVVPCGMEAARMSSVARELGAEQDLAAFTAALEGAFGGELERDLTAVNPAELPTPLQPGPAR